MKDWYSWTDTFYPELVADHGNSVSLEIRNSIAEKYHQIIDATIDSTRAHYEAVGRAEGRVEGMREAMEVDLHFHMSGVKKFSSSYFAIESAINPTGGKG